MSPISNELGSYSRTIHVHETDKDGVVHFSNYFKIAEEAFFLWLKNIGYVFENNGYSVAMIESSAKYFNPMKFNDEVNVVLSEVQMQRVKLALSFEFFSQDKILFARIQFNLVFISVIERASVPLPESLRVILTNK